ncbi:MAG: hypothetical protein LZF64_04485 [Nitrosomonas sp.]|nr:hypothetical protein [Nitrosomonas sp.]MCG7757633.1 hypothetical protein [Nitrosomonas sp.]UJP01035.1 MAG: hypothetical protein LZF64_04485 [Nitrosomonas sp.]UJP07571.1 MAG: hypothetical protein LZF84_00190 [Nitrosomonas sp.]
MKPRIELRDTSGMIYQCGEKIKLISMIPMINQAGSLHVQSGNAEQAIR